MITQTVHEVESIKVDGTAVVGDAVYKMITIIQENGKVYQITLFADHADNLEIKE